MWQEQRYRCIRSLLATYQQVSTDQIVTELGVSRETVRRDLLELEALGELKRVHGGAIKVEDEPPIEERVHTRVKFKRAIARLTASMVSSGQTLFIDAGSTTVILAEELAKLSGLTIITNSFDVAISMRNGREQRDKANELIVLGGVLDDRAPATVGSLTVAEIYRYRADIALLSPVGVDLEHGATNFDHQEADVARAMVAGAERVFILADYSKIGLASRVAYCPVKRIDLLITNSKAAEEGGFADLQSALSRVALA
ncbi:MAG: DeoR/GlpR transcriptional regulator [Gammaproteobacteria bacterium]|nr:DeoR/GlpR transcriptional regulator [Gammaproteobacteria bacterium]